MNALSKSVEARRFLDGGFTIESTDTGVHRIEWNG